MVARKIFHVLVGFWFGNMIFAFTYLGSSGLYYWWVDRWPTPTDLTKFAAMTGVALPLALGVAAWKARRYIAIGLVLCAVASFCWVVLLRPNLEL